MSAHDDAAVIRRGYAAFMAGDLATLSEVIAADATWHVMGHNRLSGSKQGREAIFGYFGALHAGGIHLELHDVVANDEHLVGLHRGLGEQGDKQLDSRVAMLFHVRGGQIQEVWEQADDTGAWDTYFGQ
jgi:ketosteroid isomerase-like protein